MAEEARTGYWSVKRGFAGEEGILGQEVQDGSASGIEEGRAFVWRTLYVP
jgi:hypothetical protein